MLFLGKAYPFTLGVTFNEDEVCSDAEEDMANVCEASETPGGIIGFALAFTQMSCWTLDFCTIDGLSPFLTNEKW